MDHLLNDKKAETILESLKNASLHLLSLIDFRLIKEESSKTIFGKNFVNRKVLLESMEHLIPHHQVGVKVFNRTVQNFITSAKDHQKDRNNLEESINELYYNDREHLIMKVAPLRAMMNVENKDLIEKIPENTKKEDKRQRCLYKLFENSIIRVSNLIRFLNK